MQSSDDNQATVWLCHECNHEYNRDMIEQELLEVVHQRVMAFQLQVRTTLRPLWSASRPCVLFCLTAMLLLLQDLKCQKCRMIKADNMSKQCECSGAYETTTERETFLKKLKTMYNIAAFHKVGAAWPGLPGQPCLDRTLPQPSPDSLASCPFTCLPRDTQPGFQSLFLSKQLPLLEEEVAWILQEAQA